MDIHQPSTTPFGRRSFTLAMVASQTTAKECPPGAAVHKWEVFRAICEGKDAVGVSERALSVLNALLTFHPDTVLTGADELVVFPSNQQLALRAHGMAAATLRRHIGTLVDSGVIIRRDSPNGKRYARKGQGGAIEKAFGFDLKPLVARAAEYMLYAEEVRAERRALTMARERMTLRRRDITKMITAGMEEGVPCDWPHMLTVYRGIAARIPRSASRTEIEPLIEELDLLAAEILIVLETHVEKKKRSGSESHSERHIQNSKTEASIESEPRFTKSRGEGEVNRQALKTGVRSFPLSMVLDACPTIVDYAKGGEISNWRDMVATAGFVRSMLGISPSAWDQAQEAFGAEDAATVIAAILERSDAIKSPGGYLRGLTDKQAVGQFSVGPMLMALLRGRSASRLRA
ncbi:plasmid replication protein RepC [Beijerinckia sp. L45]|uniref:plasmid replication protein RepC n=1 Tax=Beijerinckia sp. L45 TaxID=1641855 RepID=UPI00131E0F30|nr:plasmid replication protein RepC [Beijerinckia sp. L45]